VNLEMLINFIMDMIFFPKRSLQYFVHHEISPQIDGDLDISAVWETYSGHKGFSRYQLKKERKLQFIYQMTFILHFCSHECQKGEWDLWIRFHMSLRDQTDFFLIAPTLCKINTCPIEANNMKLAFWSFERLRDD
jgi:hypothetical protein